MKPLEVVEYKGYNIKIYLDEDPENPRTAWDNFGHMICFHSRYNLGDKHDMSLEDAKELEKSKDVISLPLYLYDHSGLTIRTYPFSCPWDSGKIGFVYVTKEEVRKEYSCKLVTKKIKEKVINLLRSEVEEYDNYLTGEVYGYRIVDDNEEERDSCWGFFGNEWREMILSDCKQMIDYYVEEDLKEKVESHDLEINAA